MMEQFYNWMVGAIFVAVWAISFGYGAGMMWRAWQSVTNHAS
jgi:hypothetical protein